VMCWVLYLASDKPLPVIPWDPGKPGFNVEEIARAESPVSRQFSGQYIYIVGSHSLCGCGFDRAQANPDHPNELVETEESLVALHAYLGNAVRIAGQLELYSCWDGDQAAEPDHRWVLTPEDITPTMGWFPDRTFAAVSAG
jgi:hypothetical protein